jgi:hypothetical protein
VEDVYEDEFFRRQALYRVFEYGVVEGLEASGHSHDICKNWKHCLSACY